VDAFEEILGKMKEVVSGFPWLNFTAAHMTYERSKDPLISSRAER
jgi:hypothetical protein